MIPFLRFNSSKISSKSLMIFKKHSHEHGVSKRVKVLAWLSILGWTCLIVALVLFHYGRPELETGIIRYFGIEVRKVWLPEFRFWYAFMLSCCALISIVSLWVNRSRVKHHHRIRYNVVLLLLVSMFLLATLMINP